MQSNDRLYGKGITPAPVPEGVIRHRCLLLKIQLDTELNKPSMEWDTVLTNDIVSAIKFWQNINSGGK